MPKEMKADFCIEIDFEKGTESPSRVFRAMTELIEAFQAIDTDLVQSIDAKIEPVAIIEDIEAGSIKAWLGYILRAADDDALKNLDWKPAVGRYLVKAKYFILDFIAERTSIVSRDEMKQLENELLELARETDVTHFPNYVPVQRQKLLPDINRITSAVSYLTENDKASYVTAENKLTINAQFHVVPETIEDLLTRETLESTSEMILKVKKPDYLGDSQWEVRHGTRSILMKIEDNKWLKEFQSREHDVRPGDSLRAMVKISVNYGFDNEVVATHYSITEVKDVIRFRPTGQASLPLDG